MKVSRRFFLTAGAAAATVMGSQFITSCTDRQSTPDNNTSTQTPATSATGEINLYSSRHYNTDTELYNNFTKETGIKINLIEGKDDELIERIKSEGNNSPADILITVDAGRLWRADQAGIFAPVNSSIITEKIPESLRDPEGKWFGFTKRARVIMYHTDKVNPNQLSTYEDLADPKWKGKIIVRSSSNIYNLSLVASFIAVHGEKETEEWVKGFLANFARQPEGNDTEQIQGVASGVADLALANTYYLARLAKSDKEEEKEVFSKVKPFFPNQGDRGTHVNISGGGLIKTAPNPEGAIKFLEYLTSNSAQTFFAQGNNEYPVVEGIPVDPIVAQFGSFKSDTTNVALYGENNAKALEIMDRAGWV
jgi:iron(III) transport system substrate-binding protein